MSCLTIIQSAYKRIGLAVPNAAATATDLQAIQFLSLLNEEGQELAANYPWSVLQQETSFTTLAQEDQGAIATIAPGMKYIINDTIWNRSLRRPVFGPKAPPSWQQQKAFSINGPWSNHRIKGGHLYMYPVPAADQSCYFEYISENWATDSTGATGKAEFTADDDLPLLDEQLLTLGLIWRWKKVKGFEFGADYELYEKRVMDAKARDAGKDWISMSGAKYDIMPGVVVPAGSWNL